MTAPVAGFSSAPWIGMRPSEMREVPLGVRLAELPALLGERVDDAPVVCRANGEWIDRASWESLTIEGDVIEFHRVPQDRDTLRGVLSIAAIAVLGPYGLGLQGAALIAATFAAQLAINALLPPTQPQAAARPVQTGDAFSTSMQGNEARLDQPIWRICGHKEITPPYACEPYFEYLARTDSSNSELDREQYFYALFAVGVGDYDVVAKIGNTPISRFADVLVAQYLAPGERPSQVLANVTTADEVSSQVLESGRYVGGFVACAARRTCDAIGIDIAATRGLGKGESALTVTWQVQYRPINAFGQVLGSWQVLANETRTAYTATPQRWSNRYDLPSPARVEVRVVRTDVQDTDPSALHELAWIGLRGYLAEPAPLNEYTAHYEVVLRASSQLSQAAARDLRLIARGKCRSLGSGLAWQAEAYTRNPFWWALDLITSQTWGMRKPDDRVDLEAFYELAVQADQRQDRFDYAFDQTLSAWEALQLICRAGRARAFRRNGVISVARDELADVPVTAFTHRNCLPGVEVSETLRQRNSPDGVVIEYQDHRTGEWTPIECPCPGVSGMSNPVRKRLEGVTGETHARREGLYEAASLLYRTRTVSWTTEMEGMLPAYMSPVRVMPDQLHYGQSGDVAFWDADTLVMGLTEQPRWDDGDLWLTLVRDDGTLTTPVLVTPGPTVWDVTLPAAPDFALILDDGGRERPKFLLGNEVGAALLVKVTSIEDGRDAESELPLYNMTGLVDDERVHTADNAYLPGPDDDQDPVGLPDDSDDEAGGGVLLVPRLDDALVQGITFENDAFDLAAAITLRNIGTAFITQEAHGSSSDAELPNQWLLYGAAEPSQCGLFEVRATLLASSGGGANITLTGTLGTWEALDTERSWRLEAAFVDFSTSREAVRQLRIEIRETSTGIVQDSATVSLETSVSVIGGG